MSCSGGDAGYRNADKREEYAAREVDWFFAMHQDKQATMHKSDPLIQAENIKGGVRARVERGFFTLSLWFIEATFVTSS